MEINLKRIQILCLEKGNLLTIHILHNIPYPSCYGAVMAISDLIQKVSVNDYLGLNFKGHQLLLNIAIFDTSYCFFSVQ